MTTTPAPTTWHVLDFVINPSPNTQRPSRATIIGCMDRWFAGKQKENATYPRPGGGMRLFEGEKYIRGDAGVRCVDTLEFRGVIATDQALPDEQRNLAVEELKELTVFLARELGWPHAALIVDGKEFFFSLQE